jgi:hypothetical protein
MLSTKIPKHSRGETLEFILDEVGDAKNTPPPPAGGIPPQRLPGIIRWPIRTLLLPFVLLDILAVKLAKFFVPPPYRQEGGCMQRGNCCHYIIMEKPDGIFGRLHYYWNTEINGFYPRNKEAQVYKGVEIVVMGCRYLQKNGSCGHYHLRPRTCRDWPLIEYFGKPQFLKGCGFRAAPRNPEKKES